MKKILAAFVGVVVLAAAGLSLWHFLGTSSPVATIGTDKVTVSDVNDSVNEILAERKGVSTTGMQLATGADLTLAEVNFHVIAYLLADTASENLVNVTQAEIASLQILLLKLVANLNYQKPWSLQISPRKIFRCTCTQYFLKKALTHW